MEEAKEKPPNTRKRAGDKWKHQARPGREQNLFVRMQETEEGRLLWKIWTDRRFLKPNGKGPGRPRGAMDGMYRKEREQKKAVAKEEAKRMVRIMEKKGFQLPENEFAREALEAAVETMRMEAINPKDKLTAARLVLEFTKAKPAAQAELTVRRAEDYLAEIAKDMVIEEDKE
jgi:hypothetical protein